MFTEMFTDFNELSNFLVDVAKAGYGKTRKQIMGLAESVARDKGRMTGQKKAFAKQKATF